MSLFRSSNLIKSLLAKGNHYKKINQGNSHQKATFHKLLRGENGKLNMVQSYSIPTFDVRRSIPELVCPSQPTPTKVKLLSDIDVQELLVCQQRVVLFYPTTPDMKDRDPAKLIKNALAKALVYYFPWAGRVRDKPPGQLAVDCTAEGVLFGEADVNFTLEELGEQPLVLPFPYLDELIYDNDRDTVIDCPMLTMQVTRLSCGGFILAFKFCHALSDGVGLVQFLATLTEFTRGASTPSVLPVGQRDLLNSREPRHVSPNNHLPLVAPIDLDMVHRNFTFDANDVATLRACIPPHLRPCTAFELITAALWHCRTIALQFDPEEEVRLAFVVGAWPVFNPPIPTGYYGNAITFATVVSSAGKLYDNYGTLDYAVEQVKKAKGIVMEEYKRSLIEPAIWRGHNLPLEDQTYIISDASRLGFLNLDFGWGKPVYFCPVNDTYLPHLMSFITPFRNEKGEEVKVVTVYLHKDAMDRFSKALDYLLKEQKGSIHSWIHF